MRRLQEIHQVKDVPSGAQPVLLLAFPATPLPPPPPERTSRSPPPSRRRLSNSVNLGRQQQRRRRRRRRRRQNRHSRRPRRPSPDRSPRSHTLREFERQDVLPRRLHHLQPVARHEVYPLVRALQVRSDAQVSMDGSKISEINT